VRAEAAAGLGFLGVELDAARNTGPAPGRGGTAGAGDREIGRPGAPVRAFVIPAREDIEIARGVRAVLER